VALDGETYFYQNPLADEGKHRRQPWFTTACCPPNVARLLASLPGYVYSLAGDEIWVHLYAESTATLRLPDGREVELRQQSRYPWEGEIAIEVHGQGEFGLRLRIPEWCESGATVRVNGASDGVEADLTPGDYAVIRRTWRLGDVVQISLPMPVRRLQCHPHVTENAGHVALMRGPLLYCLEQVDHPGTDIRDLVLRDDARFEETWRPDLLDGVVTLTAEAVSAPADRSWDGTLYRSTETGLGERERRPARLTAVPYYAWANREPGPMRIWIPRLEQASGDFGEIERSQCEEGTRGSSRSSHRTRKR
jgi:DUF1680 family protein